MSLHKDLETLQSLLKNKNIVPRGFEKIEGNNTSPIQSYVGESLVPIKVFWKSTGPEIITKIYENKENQYSHKIFKPLDSANQYLLDNKTVLHAYIKNNKNFVRLE